MGSGNPHERYAARELSTPPVPVPRPIAAKSNIQIRIPRQFLSARKLNGRYQFCWVSKISFADSSLQEFQTVGFLFYICHKTRPTAFKKDTTIYSKKAGYIFLENRDQKKHFNLTNGIEEGASIIRSVETVVTELVILFCEARDVKKNIDKYRVINIGYKHRNKKRETRLRRMTPCGTFNDFDRRELIAFAVRLSKKSPFSFCWFFPPFIPFIISFFDFVVFVAFPPFRHLPFVRIYVLLMPPMEHSCRSGGKLLELAKIKHWSVSAVASREAGTKIGCMRLSFLRTKNWNFPTGELK